MYTAFRKAASSIQNDPASMSARLASVRKNTPATQSRMAIAMLGFGSLLVRAAWMSATNTTLTEMRKPPVEAIVVVSPCRTLVHTPNSTVPLTRAQAAVVPLTPRSLRWNTAATATKATAKRRNTMPSGERPSRPIFMNSHERPHAAAMLSSKNSLFLRDIGCFPSPLRPPHGTKMRYIWEAHVSNDYHEKGTCPMNRRYRTLIEVMRLKSLTKAAEKTGYTQSGSRIC